MSHESIEETISEGPVDECDLRAPISSPACEIPSFEEWNLHVLKKPVETGVSSSVGSDLLVTGCSWLSRLILTTDPVIGRMIEPGATCIAGRARRRSK